MELTRQRFLEMDLQIHLTKPNKAAKFNTMWSLCLSERAVRGCEELRGQSVNDSNLGDPIESVANTFE